VIKTTTQNNHPIIAVINQKGGVGKSTTAINLSAALGEAGDKVLLVDLDPQGNATSGLGIDKTIGMKCIYDGLINDEKAENIIISTKEPNIDIIPATINLAGAELELVSMVSRETRLAELIRPQAVNYDFLVVDCPPSLGLLTLNGLTAADSLIIPIQCEYYALEGLSKLLDTIRLVKTRLNPRLEIFGVLLTMYDGRTSLANQVADEVRNFFGDKVFSTKIPRTVRLAEAPGYGQSAIAYNPQGKGANAYRELAKEVMSRG